MNASTALRFEPKEGVHLYFQLARTSERLYVRLRWKDATPNRSNTVDEFSDGAAVQWALNGVDTSYMMGNGPKKPVNIWYWRADREAVENLAAGGFGSTTDLPVQSVTGKALYRAKRGERDNEWQVVMSRKLVSPGEHQAKLQKGTLPMAFALWQGEEGQRDGNKRVSHGWILLNLQPAALAGQSAKASAKAKSKTSLAASTGVKTWDVARTGTSP